LQGDFDCAQALQEESLAIARELGDELRIATALNNLALVVWNKDVLSHATQLLEESAAIKRTQGNLVGLASSLNNLAMLADQAGDKPRAIAYMEETLAIDRQLGNRAGIADSLGNLASLLADTSDLARSAAYDVEALEMKRDLGDRLSIAYSLASIAATVSRAGMPLAGARLLGAHDRLREELGAPVPPSDRLQYDAAVALARAGLSEEAFAAARHAGQELSLDDAVAEALHIARGIARPESSAA
jgi:hypothetical protein